MPPGHQSEVRGSTVFPSDNLVSVNVLHQFHSGTLKALSSLTLSDYESSTISQLCAKYHVSAGTLQRFASATFALARKRSPSKLQARYGDIDWMLNDTQIARLLVTKRFGTQPPPKALAHTRERVRQLRLIFSKPKSPMYRRKVTTPTV